VRGARRGRPAGRAGDPRRSIEERYSGRGDYLTRIRGVAEKLAAERYILEVDVPRIVESAGEHWDWRMSAGAATH